MVHWKTFIININLPFYHTLKHETQLLQTKIV